MPLERLPHLRKRRIVIGTTVRKPAAVLRYYLDALAWQEVPDDVERAYCFVNDGCAPDAKQMLVDFVQQHGGVVMDAPPVAAQDFSDTGAVTHAWSESAMHRVGRNKTEIIHWALQQRADAVWFCDADLICDRTTLQSLLACDVPVACAVYWTHWQRNPGTMEVVVHAGPQVWLNHPYHLTGRGMDESEFRRKLIQRQLTQVWGQGACTLIKREVFEAGVNFLPLPDVPQQGMMAGEDRQFCIACERRHIPMFADPWPDIYHIYHLPEDLTEAAAWSERLGSPHPEVPRLGDWVSLIVEGLEGVPQPSGPPVVIPPQHIRGRLGSIVMLAELEEAIYGLRRGDSRVVPVHVPVSYPIPQFRGTRRLMKVTLVDCKSWNAPPVVGRELYMGSASGRSYDATTLTAAQHEGVREVHANG